MRYRAGMSRNRIALDVAAFLDSGEARRLAQPEPAELRRIAEAIVRVCYEDLGKTPNRLDAEDVRATLRELLPARLRPADPQVEHLPTILDAFVDHVEASASMPEAFEVRRALEEGTDELLAAVRSGDLARANARPQDPFVHGAPKLSRNDPCFCGSGKKFKKCHGRNA